MKKEKNFSAALWLQIKFLYISGKFGSAKELRKHLTQTLKGRIPGLRALSWKITKEHWNKNEIKQTEEDLKARSFNDLFVKLGHGNAATAELIVKVIRHAEAELEKAKEAVVQANKQLPPDPLAIANAELILKDVKAQQPADKTKIQICEQAFAKARENRPPDVFLIAAANANLDEKFKNFKIVCEYMKEKNKLTGAYAPEKIKVPDGIVLKGLDKMSNAEIIEELKQLKKDI